MATTRLHLGLLVFASSLCALTPVARAQEIDADRYARVKAAYVLNFLRYTEWPEEAFANETSAVVVHMLGDDPMMPYLRQLTERERVNDRPLILRRLSYPRPGPGEYDITPEARERFHRELQSGHLLFIARNQQTRLAEVLEAVNTRPVLTVSDVAAFAERGGMLGLALRDNRVAFDANITRIRRSDVNVSSRVLRLARIIEEEEAEEE